MYIMNFDTQQGDPYLCLEPNFPNGHHLTSYYISLALDL